MKILFIEQPLDPPGGGQISLLILLKELNKNNYDIKVFIPFRCLFFEILKENNINVEVVPLFMLFKKIKEFSPNIIHCNSATTRYTFFSSLVAKYIKVPFIWHNRVVERASWKESLIAKLSTKIIVISDKVKEKFKNFEYKTVKVYNPIDTEKFKPNLDNKYLYDEFKISPNEKIIGVFSRLDWWKGHKLAISAFKKLSEELSNLRLLIVGEGPYKDEVISYAKKTGVYEKILLLGFRRDIAELMCMCDVVLNPSTQPEPFGRVIVEAMACGKVIIATSLGGVVEIIEHLVDGILVNPEEDELKYYIKLVLTDRTLYNKISSNALLKAKYFSKEKHCESILKIYYEVLNR